MAHSIHNYYVIFNYLSLFSSDSELPEEQRSTYVNEVYVGPPKKEVIGRSLILHVNIAWHKKRGTACERGRWLVFFFWINNQSHRKMHYMCQSVNANVNVTGRDYFYIFIHVAYISNKMCLVYYSETLTLTWSSVAN